MPPHERKWGVTSFIAYWISDAFNAATWQFGASVIAVGLTWRESVAVVALSFFIISIVVSQTDMSFTLLAITRPQTHRSHLRSHSTERRASFTTPHSQSSPVQPGASGAHMSPSSLGLFLQLSGLLSRR